MFASDINWISVIASIIGALIGAGSVIGAFLIAWGRMSGKVTDHEKRLDYSNGQIAQQCQRDSSLEAEIQAMKSRCESRDSLWRRNNDDHIELFSRVNSLEKGHAAMPGQISEMIDKKLEQWRKHTRADMRQVIEEIDREKMKFQRRKTNGHKEEEWD